MENENRAILFRSHQLRQHHQRQQDHGGGRDHGKCIGFFCPPPDTHDHTTPTPQVTTTIISKPTTISQPIPTVIQSTQTPAPVTTKQQTTSAVVTTSPAASPPSPPTVTSSVPSSNAGSSGSQPSLTSSSASLGLNQNSETTATQETASYSVYHYLTTDINGYTIDGTSTSFFAAGATSGLGVDGNSATTTSGSSSSNVGPIVGGAVGAISFILLVCFAMWFIRHRRKNRTAPSAEFLSSSRYPFSGSAEFRFRQLSDSVDQQSISEYPFEHAPQGRNESPKSFLHMREKSDAR